MSTNIPNTAPMSDLRQERFKLAFERNNETITYATNTVNDAAGDLKPTIPEEIFKRYFLPFFACEGPGTYPPNVMQEWMRISVQGLSEVDIIDGGGNVVATMPARYARGLIKVRSERNSIALSDSLATFTELNVSSPPRAMAYFHRVVMPSANLNDGREKAADAYVVALKKVLEYFGKNTNFLNTTGPIDEEQLDNKHEPAPQYNPTISDDDLA